MSSGRKHSRNASPAPGGVRNIEIRLRDSSSRKVIAVAEPSQSSPGSFKFKFPPSHTGVHEFLLTPVFVDGATSSSSPASSKSSTGQRHGSLSSSLPPTLPASSSPKSSALSVSDPEQEAIDKLRHKLEKAKKAKDRRKVADYKQRLLDWYGVDVDKEEDANADAGSASTSPSKSKGSGVGGGDGGQRAFAIDMIIAAAGGGGGGTSSGDASTFELPPPASAYTKNKDNAADTNGKADGAASNAAAGSTGKTAAAATTTAAATTETANATKVNPRDYRRTRSVAVGNLAHTSSEGARIGGGRGEAGRGGFGRGGRGGRGWRGGRGGRGRGRGRGAAGFLGTERRAVSGRGRAHPAATISAGAMRAGFLAELAKEKAALAPAPVTKSKSVVVKSSSKQEFHVHMMKEEIDPTSLLTPRSAASSDATGGSGSGATGGAGGAAGSTAGGGVSGGEDRRQSVKDLRSLPARGRTRIKKSKGSRKASRALPTPTATTTDATAKSGGAMKSSGKSSKSKGKADISSMRAALKANPKDAELAHSLGFALCLVEESYKEGIIYYEQAIELDDSKAEFWNDLGLAHYALQDWKKALEAIRKAVDVDAKHYPAWINLGNAQRQVGEDAQAQSSYEQVTNRAKLNSSGGGSSNSETPAADLAGMAWLNLGHVHRDSGRLDEAVKCYDAAIAHTTTSQAATMQQQLDDAEEKEAFSLSCTATAATAELKKAEIHFDKNEPQKTLQQCEAAKARASAHELSNENEGLKSVMARAWEVAARVHEERRDFERAMAEYKEALTLTPNRAQLAASVGCVMSEMGLLEEAVAQLYESLAMDEGESPVTRNALGICLKSVGKVDDARKQFEKAALTKIVENPTAEDTDERASLAWRRAVATANANWGHLLDDKGEYDQAIIRFKRSLALVEEGATRAKLGACFVNSGEVNLGIEQFQLALKLNPQDIFAHYNLAAAYGNRGELDKCRTHCEKALAINPAFDAAQKMLAMLNKSG